MSAYVLPESLLDEIQRMLNSYWWGSNGKGMIWLKWEKLTTSKENGGLNFSNLHDFNLAMLGK